MFKDTDYRQVSLLQMTVEVVTDAPIVVEGNKLGMKKLDPIPDAARCLAVQGYTAVRLIPDN